MILTNTSNHSPWHHDTITPIKRPQSSHLLQLAKIASTENCWIGHQPLDKIIFCPLSIFNNFFFAFNYYSKQINKRLPQTVTASCVLQLRILCADDKRASSRPSKLKQKKKRKKNHFHFHIYFWHEKLIKFNYLQKKKKYKS